MSLREVTFAEVEELFHRVMSAPEAERTAALEDATSDRPELRAEVLSLLASLSAADRVTAADRLGGSRQPATHSESAVGMRLGALELTRLLGRGGMGEVYAAKRVEGAIEQQAAVKLIDAYVDSPSMREAFFRERDLLARMAHPHIAQLLDGGISGQGAPYLVMEMVGSEDAPARDLASFCREGKLVLRERIALVIDVCEAIAYAHRRLVVHGDLKPGNVLVDPAGRVKLVDFGAARILSAASTASGIGALTPRYASPEQIEGQPIGAASDIYSMGRLLEAVADLSKERELAAVAAMATRDDPRERYASIEEMAADLENWLACRALKAAPLTRIERAGKWLRRNRRPSISMALALAVLAGCTLTAYLAARKSLREADRATQAARSVEALAHRLLFDLQPQLSEMGSSTQAQHQLATTTLAYLNELSRDPNLQSQPLRVDVVNAYVRMGDLLGNPYDENLGDPKGALEALQTAVARAEDLVRAEPGNSENRLALAMAQRGLAEVEFGTDDFKSAREMLTKSMQNFERLIAGSDVPIPQLLQAASTSGSLGDGYALSDNETPDEKRKAIAAFQRAIEIDERVVARDPVSLSALRGIALDKYKIGNESLADHPAQALDSYRQALADLDRLPAEAQNSAPVKRTRVVVSGHMARALSSLGRYAEAIPLSLWVRDRSLEAARRDPLDDRAQYDLHTVQASLARVLAKAGRLAEARKSFEDAIATLDRLMKRQPDNPTLLEHKREVQQEIARLGS
jgi:serine/threonine protein kinase